MAVNIGALPNGLFEKRERTLELCATWEISSDVAKELLASITMLLKVKEVSEPERRLQELEISSTPPIAEDKSNGT